MTYPDNIIEIYRFGRPWSIRYMRHGRQWLRQLKGVGVESVCRVNRRHVRDMVRKYRGLANYRVMEVE